MLHAANAASIRSRCRCLALLAGALARQLLKFKQFRAHPRHFIVLDCALCVFFLSCQLFLFLNVALNLSFANVIVCLLGVLIG